MRARQPILLTNRTSNDVTIEVEKYLKKSTFMFKLIYKFQRGPRPFDFGHSNIGARVLSISKVLPNILRKKIGK